MQGPLNAGYRARLAMLLAALAVIASLFACGVLPTPRPAGPSPQPPATLSLAATPVAGATATPAPTSVIIGSTPTPTVTASAAGDGSLQQPAAPDPGPAPAFQDLGDAVVSYLAASGGDTAALVAALEQWGMVPGQLQALGALATNAAVLSADLDGDGQPEVVISATNSGSDVIFGEGVLLVVTQKGGQYAVAYGSGVAGETPGPVAILALADVNNDGVSDLAFGVESCGAHTCMVDVRVLSYQNNAYVNLAEGIVIPYPDMIAIQDSSIQGFKDIVIHGNTIGSVGAGPQRASTLTYGLEGNRYRLMAVRYDPSDLLYFRIVDAGVALADGNTDEAIQLYTQAVNDQTLVASGAMMNGMTEGKETEVLRSFARFRLMVAQAVRGDQPAAQAAVQEAAAAGGPFAPLVQTFWHTYAEAKAVDPACQAVAAYVQNAPDLLDTLNSFGYANPSFAAEDVCQGMGVGLLLPSVMRNP